MMTKIFTIVWLVLSILMVFFCITDPSMDYWLFVLIYYIGVTYINIKYLETLK